MLSSLPIPVLGFAAFSGTGKTTLLTRVIPLLRQQGLRVGMVKHAHHDFDIDQPGKDSWELRKAGAEQMLIASGQRWALMVEEPRDGDPDLVQTLNRLETDRLDLVLVEGFKREAFPKVELHRPSTGRPLIYPDDASVIAFASDAPPPADLTLPYLDLNDPPAIAAFILALVDRFRAEQTPIG